jgi:hypothetical protein
LIIALMRRTTTTGGWWNETVLRGFTAAGVLGGMWWAAQQHVAYQRLADCQAHAVNRLGNCMTSSVWLGVKPYALGIGIGALMGAVAAAALILTLRRRRVT